MDKDAIIGIIVLIIIFLCIKSFFIQKFPEDNIAFLNLPLIKNKAEFDKLHFGIEDNNVVLIEAWPREHASYGTYIIPS